MFMQYLAFGYKKDETGKIHFIGSADGIVKRSTQEVSKIMRQNPKLLGASRLEVHFYPI